MSKHLDEAVRSLDEGIAQRALGDGLRTAPHSYELGVCWRCGEANGDYSTDTACRPCWAWISGASDEDPKPARKHFHDFISVT